MAEYYYRPGRENKNHLSKAIASNSYGSSFKIANGYSPSPVRVTNHSGGFGGDKTASQHFAYNSKIDSDGSKIKNTNTVSDGYPGQADFGYELKFQFLYGNTYYKVSIY